jgi:hypothetical protein
MVENMDKGAARRPMGDLHIQNKEIEIKLLSFDGEWADDKFSLKEFVYSLMDKSVVWNSNRSRLRGEAGPRGMNWRLERHRYEIKK